MASNILKKMTNPTQISKWKREDFHLYAGEHQTPFGIDTMSKRVPISIGKRIVSNTKWSEEVVSKLNDLLSQLPNSKLKKLGDDGGKDVEEWNEIVEPYLNSNWLETPWYIAESYFYRRLMEVIGYFSSTSPIDPFSQEKFDSLKSSEQAYRTLAETLSTADRSLNSFQHSFYHSLFANRADLSLWKPSEASEKSKSKVHEELNKVLVEDTKVIWEEKLQHLENGIIHFILDNVGLETVTDLFLCDYFLRFNIAKTIKLHVKNHPFFVSDAMVKDIHFTLNHLLADPSESVQIIAKRLDSYFKEGKITMSDDSFWTSGYFFHQMPENVYQDLQIADLVISKGDLNYRRILGERHYPYTTSFSQVVEYFPTSVVALRTNKADIIVGLQPGQAEKVSQEDRDWLVNGVWGVIQFYLKK